MSLQLTRPLVIFDLETTGVNITTDRIVEIYLIRVNPDQSEKHWHSRFNPGIPIPAEATRIHGISNEDVQHEPAFSQKAAEILQLFQDADIGGFNSTRFDLPLLIEELNRCGLILDLHKRQFADAQRVFHLMEPRNLAAAYRFYCNQELNDAHSAEADTKATWEIIKAQSTRYPELNGKIDQIHRFTGMEQQVDLANRLIKDEQGRETFNFGKFKGRVVAEVFEQEPSYYEWMMQGDFPADTKRNITRIWLSRLGKK